jgi:hypothetical protein
MQARDLIHDDPDTSGSPGHLSSWFEAWFVKGVTLGYPRVAMNAQVDITIPLSVVLP